MPATRCIDYDNFPWVIGQVQEGMWHIRRQICKTARIAVEGFIADADLVSTLQYVNCLLLVVVHMERGTTMRCDLDNKIIKRTTGIFARDFENQIATGS